MKISKLGMSPGTSWYQDPQDPQDRVKLQALLFHVKGQLEGVLPSTSLGETVHQGLGKKEGSYATGGIHGQVNMYIYIYIKYITLW